MDINATLIGQIITFVVFVLFTMKYVWPPITKAMQNREKKIADGLAAAEQGEHSLELARTKAAELLLEAKTQATQVIDQAHAHAVKLIEEGKNNARIEGDRLIAVAKSEIEQQFNSAKRALQNEVAELALQMAEKIVQRDIDAETHQKLLNQMAAEI